MTDAAAFLLQSLAVLAGVLINCFNQPLYYFGAMWSLSVEYQFYVSYAALVGCFALAGIANEGIKVWLLRFFSIILVISYCTRLGILSWPIAGTPMPPVLAYFVAWRFDFLLLGSVLALITDKYGALKLPPRIISILMGLATLTLILIIGMLSESPLSTVKPIHDHLLMPIAGIGFTFLVALASGRSAVPIKLQSIGRGAVWIGNRSYAMYLFHFPVMALIWWACTLFVPWLFYIHPVWYGLTQAISMLVITTLLADGTYRFVELPWNKVGERLSIKLAAWQISNETESSTLNVHSE